MADEKAKDGVEYAEIISMDILFPGKVNWTDVSPDMLKEAANSYDPEFLRAPIVLDHVMAGPAYGHVLSLEYFEGKTAKDNIRLKAKVGLFEGAIAMIESGEWNERSVFMDSYYPTPGIWYLRHLSLLGAANPAVPGMPLVVLPSMEEADDVEASQESDIYKRLIASALMAVWDRGDEYVRYRVRPVTSFKDGTFRTVTLSRKDGIKAVQGKLQKKYVPKGRNANSMVNQSILFEIDKWDLAKAKKWVKNKQAKLSADFDEDEKLLPGWCTNLIATDYQGIELPAEYQIVSVDIIPGRIDARIKESIDSAEVDLAVENKELLSAKADGGKTTMSEKETDTADVATQEPGEKGEKKKEPATTDTAEKQTATPEPTILVETESVDDLRGQNIRMAQEQAEIEERARLAEVKLRDRLKKDTIATKLTIIENTVANLRVDGYISPAQQNFGLAAALNYIPEDATVKLADSNGKEIEVRAIDVILECLKMGGKLKLKGELAGESKVLSGTVSTRVEKLAGTKNVTGLETLRRIDELQAGDREMSFVDAWTQAEREASGGDG